MAQVWYCTREEVARTLDVKATARSTQQIDRAIAAASRSVEGLCHRRFYPETGTRYFNWPNPQRARSWRLWLDDSELISVTTLSSGGVTISSSDFFLEPNRTGPPFRSVELDLDSSAAWGGGSTHQRDIAITGLWGYRNDETTVETVTEALDATETEVELHTDVGVGSVIRIDGERMIVTGRSALSTGGGIGDDLTASAANTTFLVDSGTHFHTDETILIDGERMLVVDIAGDFLTVKRAWDGSVLAAHSTGAIVYRYNNYTVERGALGTTAATHENGATIYRWDPPAPVRELTVAEALTTLLQGQAGYARTAGTGEAQREVSGRGLADLRARVYTSHGRKARSRAV